MPDNPLQYLTDEELQALFAGGGQGWSMLPPQPEAVLGDLPPGISAPYPEAIGPQMPASSYPSLGPISDEEYAQMESRMRELRASDLPSSEIMKSMQRGPALAPALKSPAYMLPPLVPEAPGMLSSQLHSAGLPSPSALSLPKQKQLRDDEVKGAEELADEEPKTPEISDVVRQHLRQAKFGLPEHAPTGRIEPWQRSAGESLRREKANRLNDLASVAEGMTKAGRAMSLGYGGAVAPPLPEGPPLAQDIRTKAAEAEDVLTPSEREYLASIGMGNIPEDLRISRLMAIAPKLGAAIGTMRGAEGRTANLEEMQARRGELQAQRRRTFERVPRPDVTQFVERASTKRLLERVRTTHPQAKNTGPFWGRVNAVLQKVGLDDPISSSLRGDLEAALAKYVRSISGAQASDREVARLSRAMAQAWQSGDTFEAMLDRFLTQLQIENDEHAGKLEQTGYHVPSDWWMGERKAPVDPLRTGFEEAEPAAAAPAEAAAPADDMVTVTIGKGEQMRSGRIPRAQLEAFKAKYPNAQVSE